MKKWKQVTEEGSSIGGEWVLDHAVRLQQVFNVEGGKKFKIVL